jgi:hypothetical protein
VVRFHERRIGPLWGGQASSAVVVGPAAFEAVVGTRLPEVSPNWVSQHVEPDVSMRLLGLVVRRPALLVPASNRRRRETASGSPNDDSTAPRDPPVATVGGSASTHVPSSSVSNRT